VRPTLSRTHLFPRNHPPTPQNISSSDLAPTLLISFHRHSVSTRHQHRSPLGVAEASHGIAPPQTSPHAATMPLAERDVNTQRQRPLTRGKRLHTAASVTDENSTPSLAFARAHETPTRQQRFFTPTKASAAKNTPSPAILQPGSQPHSGRTTPHAQQQSSKIPRRNLPTPKSKPAYDPPISKWNLNAATNLNSRTERVANTLPTSPFSPSSREAARDRSLVRRITLLPAFPNHMYAHILNRSPTRLPRLRIITLLWRNPCHLVPSHLLPMRQALRGTAVA
jgi:hypothetical protein